VRNIPRRCISLAALGFALSLSAQDKSPFSAEIVVQTFPVAQKDIGVTKYYSVVLENKTNVTQFVNQCAWTDDSMHTVIATALELQRWNDGAKRWDRFAAGFNSNCKSGGWDTARPLKTPVAPGQKLDAGGDYAGAKEQISFGDRCRFVVFLTSAGDYSNSVVSPEFQIDEHRSKPTSAPR
jgi:hypothetical protein